MTVPLAPIPVDHAPPVLGRILGFRFRLLPTLQELERSYGPVVQTHTALDRFVCLFGPDSLELAFRNRDDAFSSRLGWSRYLDHVFPGAVMAMDGDEHRLQRRMLQAVFTRPALSGYVAAMNDVVAGRIARWGGLRLRPLATYAAVKAMTFEVASRTLLGLRAGPEQVAVRRAFASAVAASIAAVRVPVWPAPYARGIAARRFLAAHFAGLVHARRASDGADLLTRLCHVVGEAGERLTDEEIVDHVLFVLMAAHDTTTSAITTTLYFLAKHPEWQDRLRAASSARRDDRLDLEALDALDEHQWVIQESLRLYPPLAVMPRWLVRPIEYMGHRIPAGTLVSFSPMFVHYMPSIWAEPSRFDPMRFSPGREEHKRHRFAFTPFGGGAHICLGQHFAMIEAKVVLHQLLRRYRWSVPEGYSIPYDLMPLAKPRDGLPLRFRSLH
jgi:cytochrome P450